jgi:hypothetical protein
MLRQGHTQTYIARMMGVNQCTIGFIKSGRHWAHVQNTRGAGSMVDCKKSPLESAT